MQILSIHHRKLILRLDKHCLFPLQQYDVVLHFPAAHGAKYVGGGGVNSWHHGYGFIDGEVEMHSVEIRLQ